MWRDSGAFAVVAPPLASLSDVALATLDRLPRARNAAQSQRTSNRLTALLLELPPAGARATLRELRFSNDRMRWIGDLLERWHAVAPAMREALLAGTPPSDATVRRWVAAIGRTRVGAFLRVAEARFSAELGEEARAGASRAMRSLYRRAWRAALRDPVETGDLAIDGGDLMQAGIKAGPLLGAALRSLLDWVLDDPARNTHDQLLARARELAGEQSHA
jgi:tRNA nucleotidyltransferase (CCA-adding enzyme)